VSATATESVKFANISATTAPFGLRGGRYSLIATAVFGGGSVTLQTLALDGTTWVPLGTAITSPGNQTYDLPPATYRIAIVTATGVYAALTDVPV
jgi:hypothetical protein